MITTSEVAVTATIWALTAVYMPCTLVPLAWKVNNTTLSKVLNLIGMIGAFAGVNFFMDFFRGLQPSLNR